jgi:hypothetical protein
MDVRIIEEYNCHPIPGSSQATTKIPDHDHIRFRSDHEHQSFQPYNDLHHYSSHDTFSDPNDPPDKTVDARLSAESSEGIATLDDRIGSWIEDDMDQIVPVGRSTDRTMIFDKTADKKISDGMKEETRITEEDKAAIIRTYTEGQTACGGSQRMRRYTGTTADPRLRKESIENVLTLQCGGDEDRSRTGQNFHVPSYQAKFSKISLKIVSKCCDFIRNYVFSQRNHRICSLDTSCWRVHHSA